ncbi:MAG: hypothetical protein AAB372_02105 [Patescibacteria group bacterium]
MRGNPDHGRYSEGSLEPHTILPGQFFRGDRPRVERELALMLAVLEEAVDVYQKQAHVVRGRGRRLFTEAEEWLWTDDTTWLFSSRNICDNLGIDIEYLRRGLRQWHKRRLEIPSRSPTLQLREIGNEGK